MGLAVVTTEERTAMKRSMVSVANATKVMDVRPVMAKSIQPIGINTVEKVMISCPTVDWMKMEVGKYLARHPGEERRAIRWAMSQSKCRQRVSAFCGGGGVW